MAIEIKTRIPKKTYKELFVDAELNDLTISQYLRWLIENREIEHCYCDVCGSVIPELEGRLSAEGSGEIYIVHVIEKMLLAKGHTKQKSLAQARKLQRDVKNNLDIPHYFSTCSKKCGNVKTRETRNLYYERQKLWLRKIPQKKGGTIPKKRGRKKKATEQNRILLPKIRKALKTGNLDALKSLRGELKQVAILQD